MSQTQHKRYWEQVRKFTFEEAKDQYKRKSLSRSAAKTASSSDNSQFVESRLAWMLANSQVTFSRTCSVKLKSLFVDKILYVLHQNQ